MAGDDIPAGARSAPRVLACDRASRILSRAESELRRAHLPEPARQRVDAAFESLLSTCAAYGGLDGGGRGKSGMAHKKRSPRLDARPRARKEYTSVGPASLPRPTPSTPAAGARHERTHQLPPGRPPAGEA